MFGFTGKPPPRAAVAPTAAESAPGYAGRRDMLDQISSFLLDNALEVDSRNLTLAHAILAGTNPRLGRQIIERQLADEPVTQAWLDELVAQEPESDNKEELNRLIAKLDRSLQQFGRNAREASTTASSYHAALSETAECLEAAGPGISDLAAMAQLTRTMIERTREVEAEMRRREAEAAALRKSLEHARRDADIDHLTGLANRRAFEAVLATPIED